MKLLTTLLLALASSFTFAQGPQTWPDAFNQEDVDAIKTEIVELLSDEEKVDELYARIQFPFRVGRTEYTKKELKGKFGEFFSSALCSEMASSEYYEVAGPEGDSYMLVCMTAPDGFDGAVPIFKRIDDVWMLTSLDLY
ncbi:MAG: hypothetical protein P8P74_02645 [Crocinitomicaceae bacterium]|nr:hypothetical protein [Crocinitomicaceae bacterium]